ncbi:TetR/AcrR family transcriptional regulator [Actinokineospora pegani]|uniref:TetR/AcrR family transcriptional regulator n=1 Tax=Actinokineospora pegani TaxID=2654637 RepID=UPI001F2D5817|nr:TetR family transcriptional regulator [Actinokineospora pegani]
MTLWQRKKQRTRAEIVAAAYELFAERGYPEVTVADIVERAEVGRSTFFRYFGDKQEVVFDGEQEFLDEVHARYEPMPVRRAPDLATALELMRGLVLSICAGAVSDPDLYRVRERLISENPDLADRGSRKLGRIVDLATAILRGMGADERTAVLAPWLARACFQAGRELAGNDPDALAPAVGDAFDSLLRQVRAPEGTQ